MFQNIQDEVKIQTNEETKEETKVKGNILTNAISKKYILLYIITFMISTIGMGQAVSPFSIAICVAVIANEIPVIAVLLISLIGNIIGCGASSILTYIITMLIFFASFVVIEPKYNDINRNEKIKLGKRIFVASLIVGIIKIMISGFLIYDLLVAITNSMLIYILYKVFVNSLSIFVNFIQKRAFTLEEIIGSGIIIVIAASAIGDFSILGFSVRNIVAIFVVLVLGWKNGVLVGTTTGVAIGVTLGIITNSEPITIAVYAISGLIAGILNRFGKIGVIIGFVIGNIILTYLYNGGVQNLILFKEILIAGIGLLAIPKSINLDIETVLGDKKFLPIGANRGLNKSREAAEKLEIVSKTVENMANIYDIPNKKTNSEVMKRNKEIFITELLNYTDNMEDNILYENISNVDGKIVDDIFKFLLKNQFIKEKDLLKILAKNNNYVVGFEDEERTVNRDVERMTQAINSSYRIAKMNFIWKAKLKEEKRNFKSQLKDVSRAISDIADDIKEEVNQEKEFNEEKNRITVLLKQKDLLVQDISINKKEDGKFLINIYIEESSKDNVEEIISNIIKNTLNEKMKLIYSEDIENEKMEKYVFTSDEKYTIDIGQAIAIKDEMKVSGDSIMNAKLKDGKYLLLISDGMGSGENARNSSQIVVTMLKQLLDSGFKKETSVKLINSNLLNISEDVFATLDLAIIDLYEGTVEFIKSGCSPTYIKNRRKIQIIKSISLPTGAIKDSTQEIYDKDIEEGDIIVMCSDGIVDSNVEFKNKELWLKYLLEDIETDNPQKIADIILNESIDNNYGKVKDDMSVLVCKLKRKI